MHSCPECGRECDCWDGEVTGPEYCSHDTTPACDIRDDLRDDMEFEDAHDDVGDWWDEDE